MTTVSAPALPSLRLVLRDRFVQVYVAVAAVEALFYASPLTPADDLRRFGEGAYLLPFIALVAVAVFDGLHTVADVHERRFWTFVGTAFSVWMVALAGIAAAEETTPWTAMHDVVFDGAYMAVYAPLLMGFEYRPHVPMAQLPRHFETSRQLRWVGLTCLVVGWFVYFVVIPVRLDPTFYESMLPSALLYLTADVVLIVRLALFLAGTQTERWRRVYGAMLAGAVTLLGVDGLEAAMHAGVIDVPGGTWVDFAWIVPPFAFLLGARHRHLPHGGPTTDRPRTHEETRDLEPERTGSLLVSAAASFPVANVAQQTTADLGRALEHAQDVAALLGMLTMAALAAVAYYVLERDRAATERAHDELEERLREATTLAAVSRLASVVHREVGTHATAARTEVERATEAGGPARDHLASARGHLDAVYAFVQRLRAISRQLPLRPMNLDLNATVLELTPALRDLGPGPVALDLKLGPDAPRVMVDPGALRDVLLTLAANAHEAMPNGGTIAITTGHRELRGHLAVAMALRPGRYGRIIVRDTGLGMTRDAVSHAFEPFYGQRDNGRGRGMGLASVHAVVAQHGGTVTVTSTIGAGTTFEILVPAVADA